MLSLSQLSDQGGATRARGPTLGNVDDRLEHDKDAGGDDDYVVAAVAICYGAAGDSAETGTAVKMLMIIDS